MARAEILTARLAGRQVAALLVDGRLDDLVLDPPAGMPRPGAIFRARIGRPVKGLGGAFVDLGGASGFLRHAAGLSPGRILPVQISGYPEPGKALPVTARVVLKGALAMLTPGAPGRNISREIRDAEERARLQAVADAALLPGDVGLVIRTAAGGAGADRIAGEIAEMVAVADGLVGGGGAAAEQLHAGPDPARSLQIDWAAIAPVAREDGAFAAARDALDRLGEPETLPGGGWMSLEPTRALVAVDVNTGADTSPASGLKANIAALRALPRALRLRGLGGQIVLDLAPTAKKDRRQIETAAKSALKACPVPTTFAGWTPLGNLELQRKRDRWPTAELLAGLED